MEIELNWNEDCMSSKVIVITGASGGIGAELARQLGKQGHKLVLAARRENELEKVAAETGTETAVVVTDVRKRQDVNQLKTEALKAFGTIDVWVNNAGRGIFRPVMELTDDDVDEIIRINVKSALYGMQTIVPYFKEKKSGHLINVSSFLSKVPMSPARSIYSAAKAALNSLTANVRMDLAAEYPNIFVSTVLPGAVSTDFAINVLGNAPSAPPNFAAMNAQNASDVAAVMVRLIESPQAEVYTNPAQKEFAINYIKDIATVEQMARRR